jgi:hypothetical protein
MSEDQETVVKSPSPLAEPKPKAETVDSERARARQLRNHPLLAAVYANRLHLVDLARVYGYERLTVQSLRPEPEKPKPEPKRKYP